MAMNTGLQAIQKGLKSHEYLVGYWFYLDDDKIACDYYSTAIWCDMSMFAGGEEIEVRFLCSFYERGDDNINYSLLFNADSEGISEAAILYFELSEELQKQFSKYDNNPNLDYSRKVLMKKIYNIIKKFDLRD